MPIAAAPGRKKASPNINDFQGLRNGKKRLVTARHDVAKNTVEIENKCAILLRYGARRINDS